MLAGAVLDERELSPLETTLSLPWSLVLLLLEHTVRGDAYCWEFRLQRNGRVPCCKASFSTRGRHQYHLCWASIFLKEDVVFATDVVANVPCRCEDGSFVGPGRWCGRSSCPLSAVSTGWVLLEWVGSHNFSKLPDFALLEFHLFYPTLFLV